MSAILPVLLGVMLAFAWNMAATHNSAMLPLGPGLAQDVQTATQQVVDQAWASATTGSSASTSTWPPAGSNCSQATPPRARTVGQGCRAHADQ